MALPTWPAYSDDTGTGQDGTELSSDFFDAIHDAIETEVQSPLHPGVSGADIIAEVVDARGSKSTLDGRLDVSLNEDGTLRGTALETAASGFRDFNMPNLVVNDTFRGWHLGDTNAPTGWALAGVGAAIQRTGLAGYGLADANRKHGAFAARITSGAGADATLTANVAKMPLTLVAWQGRKISFGCRVKTSVTNAARVKMTDGGSTSTSTLHDGSATGGPEADGWEWLYGVHTIGSGGVLQIILEVSSGANVAYFSGAYAGFSGVAPSDWIPSERHIASYHHHFPGNFAVATGKAYVVLPQQGTLFSVTAIATTAPTVDDVKIDVKVWDGGAWTSVLQTPMSMAAGDTVALGSLHASSGVAADYHLNCFLGPALLFSGTTPGALATHGVLRIDFTNDDGGNTCADVTVTVQVNEPTALFLVD